MSGSPTISSSQPVHTGESHRPQSVEEQRAVLRKAFAERPGDPGLKHALLRLIGPQYVKQAARAGIFLSYSRADELFAIQLADDLRAAGLNVWLDMTDIPFDADWRKEIVAALKRCGLMITVISPDALHDHDARSECQYFLEMGKIAVPVIHQHCKFDHLMFLHQPVDFRHDYTLGLSILTRLLS